MEQSKKKSSYVGKKKIKTKINSQTHTHSWIPLRWFDLTENGTYGRDFAIQQALNLADLDLKKPFQSN